MKTKRFQYLFVVSIGILLAAMLVFVLSIQENQSPTSPPVNGPPSRPTAVPAETIVPRSPVVNRIGLLDDFKPQPYQGESVYFFNRLGGDRGAINDSILDWGNGQVTTTISSGNAWGGVWMSLNHPIREGLPINFSAVLPPQILPAYQSQITGITVRVERGTPGRTFKLELKDGNELRLKKEIVLDGQQQVVSSDLPALGDISQFVWVLDHASAGDYVVLESVSFTATTQITDTATAAFVWSYGMLLNNWNPTTGLVRDKAKDASGDFDAIQATGSLAAATAVAEQLGIVTHADAVQIVGKISDTLLLDLPRFHGLWPHWVKVSPAGEITIVENTEWSSVDTVIAAIGLLAAQSGLGMDTSGTEQMFQSIDWNDLVTPGGIAHGYTYTGELIPSAWDVFGGESWLVALAYAGATDHVAPMAYPAPPTANGSGFIDELAWLFVPPPSRQDYWGTDWRAYRLQAADDQMAYYPTHYPRSCFGQRGWFGLSAAEAPDPAAVPPASIYQAFGVGGRFASANDGTAVLEAPVVVPHYVAMIASLRPDEAIEMWDQLISEGYFSPLTNVESLMFPASSGCDSAAPVWNQLKGSWNLVLQTLGWGRYVAERDGHVPILWQVTTANPPLSKGYLLLVPGGPTPTPTPPVTQAAWSYERECESPDEAEVGQTIQRPNASDSRVHGQFGTTSDSPWPAKSGYVKYDYIDIPQIDQLYLRLRYSKNSASYVPILIYLDDEPVSRATLYPIDHGSWEQFVWTEPILLGDVVSGSHSIKLSTNGQTYGTADLDTFVLMAGSAPAEAPLMPIAVYVPQPSETPVTPIWDDTQVTCQGKPLYMWSSPGTYLYRFTDGDGADDLIAEQKSGKQGTIGYSCALLSVDTLSPFTNFGEMLTEPFEIGNSRSLSNCRPVQAVISGHGTISTIVAGAEPRSTDLGALQAVRVDTSMEYSFATGLHDTFDMLDKKSEWYTCGYGLIHSTTSSTGTKNRMALRPKSSELTLISFTPISTNESHIRYILVDIQRGNVADYYRANITDEETAEALRRWDAGIRVVNIEEFERKIVNGQWQIVYAGTENPVIGMDVLLTIDSQ